MDYHLIACSGAETEHLLPFHTVPSEETAPTNAWGQTGDGQMREVSQLDKGFLDEHTTLVSLSIGGNDARFGRVIEHCYRPTPSACQNSTLDGDDKPLKDAEPEIIAGSMKDSVITVLEEIHRKAPNADIMLMGYPRLLENHGQCLVGIQLPGSDRAVVGLDPDEAQWLNELADVLALHMEDAAAQAADNGVPVWFADPRDEFVGEAVCGDPETIHGIVLDKSPGENPDVTEQPVSSQSFHPKNEGATSYARVMNETLRSMGL